MKKTLVVVVAIAIALSASVASAQIPNVVVYFDITSTQMDAVCPPDPAGTVFTDLYVVANNFNMWVSAIEYQISLPPSLMFLGDFIGDNQLSIGSAVTGIGISWPLPANGFEALRCQRISVIWQCQNIGTVEDPACVLADGVTAFNDHLIHVLPYPTSGKVRAIRWPDNVEVLGIGMTSVICGQTIPVEETTWGGIKALYDE
jgi:hypothetical protein